MLISLTVDDLLADKNRFKLDTDLSYYNHHRLSVAMQGASYRYVLKFERFRRLNRYWCRIDMVSEANICLRLLFIVGEML